MGTRLRRDAPGASAKRNRVRADEPIVVVVVDNADAGDRLIDAVEPMIDTGMIAVSAVGIIRARKRPHAGNPPGS
ncbi:MAG: DUF190 domain-containing protein [Bryobacteraceae bacterium]